MTWNVLKGMDVNHNTTKKVIYLLGVCYFDVINTIIHASYPKDQGGSGLLDHHCSTPYPQYCWKIHVQFIDLGISHGWYRSHDNTNVIVVTFGTSKISPGIQVLSRSSPLFYLKLTRCQMCVHVADKYTYPKAT